MNLGGNSSVPALNPSPHTIWQTVFHILEQKSNHLLNFSFALFGNPFEPCRNLDLEFYMDEMKNSCCFQVSPLSLILSVIGPIKSVFSMHFVLFPLAFVNPSIRPCKLSMLQTPLQKPYLFNYQTFIYQKKENGGQYIAWIQKSNKKVSICIQYSIRKCLMDSRDEKGKTYLFVSRTRKRRWEEIEDDKRNSFKNKFEYKIKTYQDEITLLKWRWKNSIH